MNKISDLPGTQVGANSSHTDDSKQTRVIAVDKLYPGLQE